MNNGPKFDSFTPQPVENHYTQERYLLQRVDQLPLDDEHLRQIEQACNEPLIYRRLFERTLHGARYGYHDAVSFVRWARAGWLRHQYFAFLVTDQLGQIAAAIDIKSNNLASAEIGYWCSVVHSGIMTNTVNALLDWMRREGYYEAYAVVDLDNDRSAAVLQRCGFSHIGSYRKDGRKLIKFVRTLAERETAQDA